MYQSLQELQDAARENQTLEYLFFWGHQPSHTGQVHKSCLSQWWLSDFEVDGTTYCCAEQYMMAEKAKLFGDEKTWQQILKSKEPQEMKALGRMVKNFDAAIWEAHCREIVRKGNLAKFSQNPSLKVFLLYTKALILVEASPYDTVWGIGMAEDHPDAKNPLKWKGTNYLGFALMWVRQQLRKTEEK